MQPSTKRECHPIRLGKICQCAMLDVPKYQFPLTCDREIDWTARTSLFFIIWPADCMDILQLKAPEGFHLVPIMSYGYGCAFREGSPPRETPTVMFCFPRRLWLKAAVSWCKGFQSAPFTCTARSYGNNWGLSDLWQVAWCQHLGEIDSRPKDGNSFWNGSEL